MLNGVQFIQCLNVADLPLENSLLRRLIQGTPPMRPAIKAGLRTGNRYVEGLEAWQPHDARM